MIQNFYLYALLGFASFAITIVGGFFAYKFKHKLNLIMGLTAGIILGVVAFELFPEISELSQESGLDFSFPMIAFVLGFLIFHIIEKLVLIHSSNEDTYTEHTHPHLGIFSSLLFILHSFFDGLSIGFGFLVSFQTGLIITVAVLGHKFADGLNTVIMMITNKNSRKEIITYLIAVALAPVIGIFMGSFFKISDSILAIYLGYFAGSFLYIGSSEILPEAHRKGSSYSTILMTIIGVVFVYLLTLIG